MWCVGIYPALRLHLACNGCGESAQASRPLPVHGNDGAPILIELEEAAKSIEHWVIDRGAHFCPRCQIQRRLIA